MAVPVVTTREGAKHIKTRDKSESPRPRAVWTDPEHGPGEVSPDLGPTPGQAVEVFVPGGSRPPPAPGLPRSPH